MNLGLVAGGADHRLIVSVANCTLASSDVALAIRRGELSLQNVTIQSSGGFGLYADGSDPDADEILIRTSPKIYFSDRLTLPLYAKGKVVLDFDDETRKAIEPKAKLLPPAAFRE